jgi:hypothetical protein
MIQRMTDLTRAIQARGEVQDRGIVMQTAAILTLAETINYCTGRICEEIALLSKVVAK